MKKYTLCYPIDGESVLLGYKRRGHGKDMYCGFGGKIEYGESLVNCVIRELKEESCITTSKQHISYSGDIVFKFDKNESMNCIVYVFTVDSWDGEPSETDEMSPKWFHINDMPYHFMRETDMVWLPYVLCNKRQMHAEFICRENTESVSDFSVSFVKNK